MILTTKHWKDGRFTLFEVPALDLMTQVEDGDEPIAIVKDLVETFTEINDLIVTWDSSVNIQIKTEQYREMAICIDRQQQAKFAREEAETSKLCGSCKHDDVLDPNNDLAQCRSCYYKFTTARGSNWERK